MFYLSLSVQQITRMKTKPFLLLLTLFASPISRSHAEGIPEPSLVLHGAIRNAASGNSLLTAGTLTWNVQAGPNGSAVAVSTALANLGGGVYSYRVRIPYESVVGRNTLGPNSFALPLFLRNLLQENDALGRDRTCNILIRTQNGRPPRSDKRGFRSNPGNQLFFQTTCLSEISDIELSANASQWSECRGTIAPHEDSVACR